ncbi:hypothetical protein [Haloferax sp. Atlit-48N]|uniref:Uncharacterized protein n=1 Tax=Haloferax sp. Atlit-48N TaxID=2077198 RepID=A0ACD5I3E2_9EURY|nr:hypothetical protein [Haloferax sp. Atlit-48N]
MKTTSISAVTEVETKNWLTRDGKKRAYRQVTLARQKVWYPHRLADDVAHWGAESDWFGPVSSLRFETEAQDIT